MGKLKGSVWVGRLGTLYGWVGWWDQYGWVGWWSIA